MIRVGIVFGFDENWVGGINYFRNLLSAVYESSNRKIEIVIFTGREVDDSKLQGFPAIDIVRSRLLDSGSFAWKFRRVLKRILAKDYLLESLLDRHRIAVLSHSGWLGKKSHIPTLAWIPDFQILRLPEFFSKQEVMALTKDFECIARYCTQVVVSSYDALKDIERFFPVSRGKARVMNFSVRPFSPYITLPSRDELEARYGFTGSYFLLPNQFWAHKNHRVVLEALAKLNTQGKKVLVLATGNTNDYRQPSYFDELVKHAQSLGVTDCFRVLGMVPMNDLYALMKHAIALINPSMFEGWSTTVEEGKTMGKTIVLSDIAVHQEQDPLHALFFAVDDDVTLAGHLARLWDQDPKATIENSVDVRNQAAERYRQFGDNYQNFITSLVQ